MQLSCYGTITSRSVFFPFFEHCDDTGLDLLKGNFANVYWDQNSVMLKVFSHEVQAKK